MKRRAFLPLLGAAVIRAAEIPERTVVLTMDDAVKSHRTFAGPLLKELGHRATFFVTHNWMNDTGHFMSWADIGELHKMGFEIGNHSWTHADFSQPRNAARLAGELALVENELKKVGVPKPASFAYCGNTFGPEAVAVLRDNGYRFARRGLQPEQPYGKMNVGAAYEPAKHHRLMVPTTGDAYPDWTFEYFQKVVSNARPGSIVVLQFHGVPDLAHPWVHTPPENFERYMRYLHDQKFRVIALRDIEPYLPATDPADPMLEDRFPRRDVNALRQPVELEATQKDLAYWLSNMRRHNYSASEIAQVSGRPEVGTEVLRGARILPYPGGRHVRIGFLDGAINPLRGTKASIFLPSDPTSYLVVDLPEAIFSNLGLLFLAHTHVPTIWNGRNVIIENTDWIREGETLRSEWKLPNQVSFGASIKPVQDRVDMELWLRNGTSEPLSGLRTQICVLLKAAAGFNAQTNENKQFGKEQASVRDNAGRRSIHTEWERCGRTWGNAQCPCLHSDPVLPDCAPDATVKVRGKLWFG